MQTTHGCHYIEGRWKQGSGLPLVSTDPTTGREVWKGCSASPKDIEHAVQSARMAAESWAALSFDDRKAMLETFATCLNERRQTFARAISMETGKPLWESDHEVAAMIQKVAVSVDAYQQRYPDLCDHGHTAEGTTRYKPHGVLAVFGPFNFPGHLPNGHIIPALLAGNTIVFKPSELTPWVGEQMAALWHDAGLPHGVVNLVQGGRDTGQSLAQHPAIDGILFTGSYHTGLSLSKQFAGQPNKILALELGGNNPLVVTQVKDQRAAAYLTIQSAFLTSGQRCTCARRLIVPKDSSGDQFISTLCQMVDQIHVGSYDSEPQPFMGPVISYASARQLLSAQQLFLEEGAISLVPMTPLPNLGEAFVSPGIIDVTSVPDRQDAELFGPLLQVIRVSNFAQALEEANNTRFGLSAGILTDSREEYELFFRSVRAGVVNWNAATTGASSRLPFGGVGLSGNFRPSAYFAADYCAYPVASMEIDHVAMPSKVLPGIHL